MRTIRSIAAILSIAACSAWAQLTYQWTDITPPGVTVANIGTHPIDGRIIVFGYSTPQGYVVMYSDDRGATWKASDTKPPPASAGSMFVHAGLPGVVYLDVMGAYFHPGPPAPGVFPADGHNGAVYRSDDFGRTWALAHETPFGEGIHPFASDPLDAHGVYGIARRETPCGFAPGCRFTGDIGISQTHDDGASWSASSAPPWPYFPQVFGFVTGPTPANPTRLFLQMPDSHVFVTDDRGATWSPFELSLEPYLTSLLPDPLRPNVLYAFRHYIASDAGGQFNQFVTLRSDDAGATWREIFRSRYLSKPPLIDPVHSRTLWLGSDYINGIGVVLHRTDDAGDTWQTVEAPSEGSIFLSPAEPGIVYILGNRLYRGVPSSMRDPVVVEYQYEGSRYWLTSLDGEAYSQDYRQQPGDVHRTGVKWGAWNAGDAPAGAVGSCRFWPKNARTRVLVQQGLECDILKRDANWILEGENEFFTLPPVNNSCPAGTVTVNRFINLQPDFNHRWVADPAIAAEMRARGWYDEGVRFCARPLGPNE